MQTFKNYVPPTTDDLNELKAKLGYTSVQMADLVGVAGGNQWRKYTGGATPRVLGFQNLFYLAARLELTEDEQERVFAKMRSLGAIFDFEEAKPSDDAD